MKTLKLKQDTLPVLITGIFLIVTYIFGLLVPLTSDAGKYAAISRIIYETGDWINLKIHFEPYLQKPPLIFWITAPFYYLFGPTSFAFKLPVLLYTGIAFYSTFRFTKLYYPIQTARLATLFLATSQFYFLFHNDIHTDSLLTANVIFAIWQVAEYIKSKKGINILMAGIGVGLAMISKGPIGIFVPVMAVLTHILLKKQLKLIISYKVVLAAIIGVFVVVIGLWGTFNQFGWEGIRFFFWDNNAGRISGTLKGNSNDYFFYFHTALYIFMPWGVLFFIAVFHEFRELYRKQSTELFSLGGILFYWIIISYSRAKAPHYFMVLAPFMAIISAKWMIRFFTDFKYIRQKNTIIIIQYATMVLIWSLLFIFTTVYFPTTNLILWISIAILIIIVFTLYKKITLVKIIFRSVISIIAINLVLNAHLFPSIFTYQSVIPACEIFNKEANEGEKLNTYLSEHRELFFYAKTPGYFFYNSKDLLKGLAKKGDWIYTNEAGLKEIQNSDAGIEIVKSFKHRSVSKLTPGFLNPKTRDQRLSNMYLVRIINPV